MKIIYIGLPRTSSSLMIKKVLPDIANDLGINYFEISKYIKKSKNTLTPLLYGKNDLEKLLPNNFAFGHPSIFSRTWEFNKIEENFDLLKKNFSKNTKIILFLRNPYDFLNSLYLKSVFSFRSVPEKDFFYINSKSNNERCSYNLYNFDYKNLIKMYRSYFEQVIVVKYENIGKMSFLEDIKSNYFDKNKYKRNYKINSLNVTNADVSIVKKYINNRKYYKFQKMIKKLFFKVNKKKTLNINNPYKISKSNIPLEIDKLITEYNDLNL